MKQNIKDYTVVLENYLPDKLCDEILSQNLDWENGKWYNYAYKGDGSYSLRGNNHSNSFLENYDPLTEEHMTSWVKMYKERTGIETLGVVAYTSPKVNRYDIGHNMDEHVDLIRSIFDGKNKGVPIMSTVTLLNDENEFEGGDLIVSKEKIPLTKGDMVIFPSTFMYPHLVTPVTKGTRYTLVCWWF